MIGLVTKEARELQAEIQRQAKLQKNGAQDAKVLAHLEDIENALHEAKDAQIEDLLEEPDDPADAQVLAHLEDACGSLHEALRDQYMDMMHENDDSTDDAAKSAGPLSRTLSTYFTGIQQKSAGMEEIDLRNPSQVKFFSRER